MLERVTVDGLLNRRNQPLSSQAIGMLLRNQLYAGIIDVPEYGVRHERGDFEAIITEDLFQRAQAVRSGRIPSSAPRLQAHPDFPLRNFVRCASCNRGLTGSWSKGRSDDYAYDHCRPGCRGVNVTKVKLETPFTEELEAESIRALAASIPLSRRPGGCGLHPGAAGGSRSRLCPGTRVGRLRVRWNRHNCHGFQLLAGTWDGEGRVGGPERR